MLLTYWQDRMSKAQDIITSKKTREINKQIAKYYNDSMSRVVKSFVDTYTKIITAGLEGREPTPADLYKLDSYWQMQSQIKEELNKLGNKELALLSENFVKHFQDVYDNIALPAGAAFSTISKEAITQMIESIWTTDGLAWSERIWKNNARLAETLNEELLHCVVTGKKTNELKDLLQKRFDVSFKQADTLVRTEMTHIQTIAAHKRYIDAGVSQFEVWASKDERRCEICGKLHKKRYPIGVKPPIPAHPNCRCTILPVIE
jgi:SPP1 gp7 family putative phage head morphogenesis protein